MILQSYKLLQGGKYRIERVLGQGGFGITYQAIQVALNRRVAIKEFFMKDYCERDADTSNVTLGSTGSAEIVSCFKEKFLKEATIIAQFDNPHIVRIYDIFEENGTAYYVMEYLEDRLRQYDQLVPLELSLSVIRQIGEALSYIHSQNVLHLDVKPSNILFRKDCPVLIDFGISKRYDAGGGQTSSTPVGISKGYAPLEQYNQGVQKFLPATDVYSLGATLYKLLTGQTPPEASEVNEDGLPSCPPNLSPHIWAAIDKAMQPRKKDRPQSVADFLSLLSNEQPPKELNLVANEETIVAPELPRRSKSHIITQQLEKDMVFVEGGTFMMGATPEQGNDADGDEKPAHQVSLSSFRICKHQVTQEEWETIMGNNPSRFKGAHRPVECVSWDDCHEFIKKLNQLTGMCYRLPTEAEWEYAARGGLQSKGFKFSGGNALDEIAWYEGNSKYETSDVMKKIPNELGLYDMSGNVWEWCQDWYNNKFYSTKQATNPICMTSGLGRVIRGGSWSYNPSTFFRVSYRYHTDQHSSAMNMGFRLVL